ncbi:hypothetical protein [Stutzerimonas nitrititolerans]|nr:hypothetical protein [Stutzerimonas nitrititolerans]
MNHSVDATSIPVENAARFSTLRRHTHRSRRVENDRRSFPRVCP